MFSQHTFKTRRKTILRQLNDGCAFFFSTPEPATFRGRVSPYQPNPDLFYLTGLIEPSMCLVLRSSGSKKESILYLQDRDKEREKWDGPRLGVARAKRLIDVTDIRPLDRLAVEIPSLCSSVSSVAIPFGTSPDLEERIIRRLRGHNHPFYPAPHTISDSRLLTHPMRYIKDRNELAALRAACEISVRAFAQVFGKLQTFKSESEVARGLTNAFMELGADGLSFGPMASFGPNATLVHHEPTKRTAGKTDLMLLDAGAHVSYYSADITRTVPLRSPFTAAQRAVYEIVEHARKACIDAARPGVTIEQLHRVAVNILVRGLSAAKITKEKPASMLMTQSYRKYFMHSIGHFIGLVPHDVSPYRNPKTKQPCSYKRIPLAPGVAITIEPGLYFDPKDTSVPKEFRGIGCRIEDTIVITRGGCEVLTKALPTDPDLLEELVGVRRVTNTKKAK